MSISEGVSTGKFYQAAGVAALVIIGINASISVLARNSIPRQVTRRIDQAKSLNCLALGNSLVQAGFDEKSFEEVWTKSGLRVTAINAGLGSSTPVEHLMLLRHAYSTHDRVDCLFYGFFDFQLTLLPASTPKDFIGNRAMLYYMEPQQVPRYYDWSTVQRLSFDLTRMFPAIEERGVIWEKVEHVRRWMASAGMPAVPTNRFGNVADFALLEAENGSIFSRECEQQVTRKQDLAKPIKDLLALARMHGTRVVMVEMPMSRTHRQEYYGTPEWLVYSKYLKNMLEAGGAFFVKADDWLARDEEFLDHVHANPHGASLFSTRLAELDLRHAHMSAGMEARAE